MIIAFFYLALLLLVSFSATIYKDLIGHRENVIANLICGIFFVYWNTQEIKKKLFSN